MFLLNKFRYKKWYKLTSARRQDVLQKLENKMARRAGRPALPLCVKTDTNWNCYGMFEHSNGKSIIYINIHLLTDPALRFQAMATILHEGRHATQYYIINSDLAWFQFRAKGWKRNIQEYVSSAEDSSLYRMQEVERDAQLFAIKHLKRWRRKYENEEDFERTFEIMKRQYNLAEEKAIKKYGKFYRYKIRKEIKNKKRLDR